MNRSSVCWVAVASSSLLAAAPALAQPAPAGAQVPPPNAQIHPSPRHRVQRFQTAEVSAGLGVHGVSFVSYGARQGDLLVVGSIEGRWLRSGFTVDGGLLTEFPTAPGGMSGGMTLSLRVGWTGYRWSVLGGVTAQYTPGARPEWQPVPSLRAEVSVGRWGVSAGFSDFAGLAPWHLTFEYGSFGVGWVGLVGAHAFVRVPVANRVGLRLHAVAFSLANSQIGMLMVSMAYGERAGSPRVAYGGPR